MKNVEFDDMDQSPCVISYRLFQHCSMKIHSKRIKQLNDMKIKLDRIEVFLKDREKVLPCFLNL